MIYLLYVSIHVDTHVNVSNYIDIGIYRYVPNVDTVNHLSPSPNYKIARTYRHTEKPVKGFTALHYYSVNKLIKRSVGRFQITYAY